MPHDIQFASRSEIGARKGNEDYLQHGTLEQGWFAVLSDGAGGHSDGAVAADLVVRMVAHELSTRFAHDAGASPADTLEQVAHAANEALNRRQEGVSGV